MFLYTIFHLSTPFFFCFGVLTDIQSLFFSYDECSTKKIAWSQFSFWWRVNLVNVSLKLKSLTFTFKVYFNLYHCKKSIHLNTECLSFVTRSGRRKKRFHLKFNYFLCVTQTVHSKGLNFSYRIVFVIKCKPYDAFLNLF